MHEAEVEAFNEEKKQTQVIVVKNDFIDLNVFWTKSCYEKISILSDWRFLVCYNARIAAARKIVTSVIKMALFLFTAIFCSYFGYLKVNTTSVSAALKQAIYALLQLK